MAMLPSLDSTLPNWAADNIPSDCLHEEGIETEPHVTVLYGFHLSFDASKIAEVLPGSVSLKLGKVSRFECPEYDVLKVDVDSGDLEKLNAKLAKVFGSEITKSKHNYHPHLTISYVKKGACKELDRRNDFEGWQPQVVQLLYSLPEKQGRRVFDLGSSAKAVQAAQGAFAAGHKFWGNQWSRHAVDLANDPAGEPSGKIRHAVLVIGGKRYRGPSHFQALTSAPERDWTKVEHEGFQTESGHFLNRKQAAQYVGADSGLTSERAKGEFGMLATREGRLYTQDRVMAAEPVPIPAHDFTAHEQARAKAEAIYKRAVAKVVAQAEASALASRLQDEDERKKRRAQDEEAALFLFLLAGVAAYKATYKSLAATPAGALSAPGAAFPSPEVQTAPTGPGAPAIGLPVAEPDDEVDRQAETYAKERGGLLKDVPGKVRDALDTELAKAEPETTLRELSDRLGKVAQKVEDGYGKMVVNTETHTAYGHAALRVLAWQGYATKLWQAVGDERTCPTCMSCEDRGPLPMGDKFVPGVVAPPAHNSCRCWLVGGQRAQRGKVESSEPVGHEFHGNPWTSRIEGPFVASGFSKKHFLFPHEHAGQKVWRVAQEGQQPHEGQMFPSKHEAMAYLKDYGFKKVEPMKARAP